MYNVDAIKRVWNFITDEEADVLTSYLLDQPDFFVKHVWTFDPMPVEHDEATIIEDQKIIDLMNKISKQTTKYAIQNYFPSIGVDTEKLTLSWTRNLELIGWTPFTGLGPHADGEEGEPGLDGFDNSQIFNLGCLVYLNDDYADGEIDFPDWKVTIKPVKGDLVFFPPHYIHQVMSVPEDKDPTKKIRRFTMPMFYSFRIHE